ncbi:hypothetical protein GEMRC1_014078 [Eukaryota sp. GEM-RC1]
MFYQDRTAEFHNLVSSIQSPPAVSNSLRPSPHKSLPGTQFTVLGSAIASKLSKIGYQLEQMTEMVKSQSTLGDSTLTGDIQRLSHVIRQNISRTQESQHKQGVIQQLSKKLRSTSQQYKETLEIQSKTLQDQHSRRDRFMTPRDVKQSTFVPRLSFEEEIEPGQQSSQMLESSSDVMSNRREAVQSIESHLAELAQLFTTFNTMVAEQGDAIIHIERNVDEAFADVQGAERHIERIWNKTKNDRKFLLKIFALLAFFVVLFGFVL